MQWKWRWKCSENNDENAVKSWTKVRVTSWSLIVAVTQSVNKLPQPAIKFRAVGIGLGLASPTSEDRVVESRFSRKSYLILQSMFLDERKEGIRNMFRAGKRARHCISGRSHSCWKCFLSNKMFEKSKTPTMTSSLAWYIWSVMPSFEPQPRSESTFETTRFIAYNNEG